MVFARLLTPICFLAISLHRSAEAQETPVIAAKRLCDLCHVFVEDLQDTWGSRMKENGDVPLDSAAGHELVEQFCKTRNVQKFKGPDKKVHESNCEHLTKEYTEDIVNEFIALEGRVSKLGSLPILQDEICGQHLAELCPVDDIMADTHSDKEVKCRACIALVEDVAFEVRRNPAWLRLMQKPEKASELVSSTCKKIFKRHRNGVRVQQECNSLLESNKDQVAGLISKGAHGPHMWEALTRHICVYTADSCDAATLIDLMMARDHSYFDKYNKPERHEEL